MTECGKPTKPGTPCRQQVGFGRVSCNAHETEQERAYREGYEDGHRAGCEGVADYVELERRNWDADRERERERTAAARPKVPFGGERRTGFVQVWYGARESVPEGASGYVYTTVEPAAIGDVVRVPTQFGEETATVVAFGHSGYGGTVLDVHRVIEHREAAP